jgi:DNA-binding MarR family transcriptional regulator
METLDPGPEALWLDAEEQLTWLAFAYLLVRLPATLDAQMEREAGLSHFEYLVLAVLSMAPHRTLRMSDVADYTASSLSRLSNVAVRLERQGLLRRAPDPTDRRCTLALLTDSGWDKVVASAPGHVGEVRRLVFGSLTKPQQRSLREIARRILRTIDPEGAFPEDRLRALT